MAAGGAALFEIALVVFLGAPERAGRRDFRGDGAAQLAPGFEGLLGLFRRGFLLRRMKKYRGAILRAIIGSLAVHLRRIVDGPENVQQFVVADLLGIKRDLHDFGMAGRVRTDFLVIGILRASAAIADHGVQNARDAAKRGFDAPKTSRPKCSDFLHVLPPWLASARLNRVLPASGAAEIGLAAF